MQDLELAWDAHREAVLVRGDLPAAPGGAGIATPWPRS
jgi:hypothetical protein